MNNKTDFVRQSYSDIAQGKEDTILFASQDEQIVSSSVGYSKEEISLVPEKAIWGLAAEIHFISFQSKKGTPSLTLAAALVLTVFLLPTKLAEEAR